MTFWYWDNLLWLLLENVRWLVCWISAWHLGFCALRHFKWAVYEGIRVETHGQKHSAWTDIRFYQHTQSGSNQSCNWELLSSIKLFCISPPLLYPSNTTLPSSSAFALLWQCWMSPIVLGTLQPPRQTSSLFLSQSSPWSSPSSVCPQNQSRRILHTTLYHLVCLRIFSPKEDADSVGANGKWPGSSSS